MYSNRGMPLGRLWRKRKGKPLDRSCAHKTVPKQQKAVWAKASHCGLNREKTGNGRGNRDSVSKVQVRRTAVSAAYCGEKDECVGRALPVAFGTGAPFFLTRKAAVLCFYRHPPATLKYGGFSFLQKPSALPVSAPTLYKGLTIDILILEENV